MFFMVRSAVCIGVVFCMLPDGGGPASFHGRATEASRSAASRVEAFCAMNAACALAGARVVAAVMTDAGAPVDRRRAPILLPVREVGPRSSAAKVQPRS